MKNYKIKVNDEAESKEAQDLFFELGCEWRDSKKDISNLDAVYIYADDEILTFGFNEFNFRGSANTELTLPQLRDLVVLHRNDVKDATHTDGERKGFLSSDGVEYFWNAYDLEWFQAKQMTFAYEKFKPINEQGLISGADALRALADGQLVQWMTGDAFQDVTDEWQIREFSHPSFKFRLKPRTITINGIEVPAPFDGSLKHKQYAYVLNTASPYGYSSMKFYEGGNQPLICWTDEEEIKQVVSALRSVFKGGV